jgi:hypothetical protein
MNQVLFAEDLTNIKALVQMVQLLKKEINHPGAQIQLCKGR